MDSIKLKKDKVKRLLREKVKEEDFLFTCLKSIDGEDESKIIEKIERDLKVLGDFKKEVLTRFKREGVVDLKEKIKSLIIKNTKNS